MMVDALVVLAVVVWVISVEVAYRRGFKHGERTRFIK